MKKVGKVVVAAACICAPFILVHNDPILTASPVATAVPQTYKPVQREFMDWLDKYIDPADASVDITFALQCRGLESQWQQRITLPYLTAVTDYEAQAAQYAANPAWERAAGIEYYDKGFLIAYNHGVLDGNSAWDVSGTHVTEVTPNVIRVAGNDDGFRVEGYFDRRTGHGEIFQYMPGEKPSLGSKVNKMFLLQCEPSKPAKF